MRTFKLAITEDELKALIDYHRFNDHSHNYTVEQSARLHDLTKRFNRETPEITVESDHENNEPVPKLEPAPASPVEGWPS